MSQPDNLITAKDVRNILGNVSDMTIYRWLHYEDYKKINFPKPFRIGKRRYWKRSALESWINAHAA